MRFGNWRVSQEIVIECSIDAAWTLITDIARIGELSPECVSARWTCGSAPEVGNTFDGTNLSVLEFAGQQYEYEWTRPCRITASEPRKLFSYSAGDRYDGTPASDWAFELMEIADGKCKIIQTFQHRPDGLSGCRIEADADPTRADEFIRARSADLSVAMQRTLLRMKEVLENR